ncbi:MAG TPA: ATP-dependent DNA helicase RecQ [Saprospiraceae bacterium]|nr:ATP-dependent DNA helicase RecQ [Saprospiraceae bacterium]
MKETALEILQKYWNYEHFRPLQQEIIQSVLDRKDTIALLPTGGGKSICFQVPALMQEGVTIVVSPLISLIKAQVKDLRTRGVKAEAIFAGIHFSDIQRILNNCLQGGVKLLYVSPERLQTDIFINHFLTMKVSYIAVDEAHCISQWGYDFRPAYLQIKALREMRPEVVFLAVTATATNQVISDISEKLSLVTAQIFRKSFYRENIALVMRNSKNKRADLFNVLNKVPGSAIIYMRSRAQTVEIAKFLQENKFSVAHYHAGMEAKDRDNVQDKWMRDKIRIMVATTAFGMGIDKPDVRCVIHLDLPSSPEEYYQEAGRAGRDNRKSYSAVFYNQKDISKLTDTLTESFPDEKLVIEIYEFLAIRYRVAIGDQNSSSYPFDLYGVARELDINSRKLLSALKILEWNGYLYLSEAIEFPDRVMILWNKQKLFSRKTGDERTTAVIDILLRLYGGILNLHTKIQLTDIARKTNLTVDEVQKILRTLDADDVISFQPSRDTAMISFGNYRHNPEYLRLDMTLTEFIKERTEEKVNAILRLVNAPICRNIVLLNYFDEERITPCGSCDICLENKKREPNKEKIMECISYLIAKLDKAFLEPKDLLEDDFYIKNKHAVDLALEYLLTEQRIKFSQFKFILNDSER